MPLQRLALGAAWGSRTSAGVRSWSTTLSRKPPESAGASVAVFEPRMLSAFVRFHPPGQTRESTASRCRRPTTSIPGLSLGNPLCLRTAGMCALPLQLGTSRATSSASSSSEEVIVYSSKFESVLRAFSVGSVVQGGACTLMAAAVSLHPAAADSSLLPGWTASGRGALSGLLIGFGAAIVIGCKGFLTKQVLKVAVIPSAPDDVNIHLLSFPFGSTIYRVPRKEFYVITAAFGEFDLEAEAQGPAPILPVYVGGTVRQTLMIDVRGDFLDKDAMAEILVPPSSSDGGDWDAKADELLQKPFIPNKVKKDM